MDELLLRYIHIETGIMLIFVLMLAFIQRARIAEDDSYIRNARLQGRVMMVLFPLLTLIFTAFLYRISPLLALELAMAFTLALLHPVNALCFFVHLLFLRPWDIIPGNPLLAALPRLLAGTCLVSWVINPEKHGAPGRQTARALLLLLAFSAWLFLSTFIAANIAAAQAAWFDTFFKALIVFVMCSFFIDNKRSVSEFKYTILISIFTMAILGFYQMLLGSGAALSGRLEAVSMLDPNDLAAISIIAVPLALAPVFSRVQGLSQRLIGFLFFTVAVLTIWYSQSRGALLALAAQLVLFQCLRTFRRSRALAALLMLGIGIGYAFLMGTLTRTANDLDASKESRLVYWETALRMTARHPLLGVGYNQYPETYETYSSSLKYESGKRTAHSSWLLAFAESGLLGGLLFAAFFITVLQTAWRNRAERPDQFYALGGYAVAMTFLSHTYLLFPYLLYGLILASDSVKERMPDAD